MVLPLYLAMTRAEMAGNPPPAAHLAYMACHFSPAGTSLSNCPEHLVPGSMLVLDDSTPMDGHDPERILKELSALMEAHRCESLLLDFQRPGNPAQMQLAEAVSQMLPYPVGVSEQYAHGLPCTVFLSTLPPDRPLEEYLKPWQGREIWLEAALDAVELTLTENGCTTSPLPFTDEEGFSDSALHCHYSIQVDTAARFRLWRTREDLEALLREAETAGVTRTIGLWQELGEK